MRTQLLVVAAVCGGLVVGCSSKEPAGHALAVKACQSTGQTAATYAADAAAQNSIYSTLAADERAAAVQEAQAGAATGLGTGGAATILSGQGAGFTVIEECVRLGLPATPSH